MAMAIYPDVQKKAQAELDRVLDQAFHEPVAPLGILMRMNTMVIISRKVNFFMILNSTKNISFSTQTISSNTAHHKFALNENGKAREIRAEMTERLDCVAGIVKLYINIVRISKKVVFSSN
ncbi:hypothetical protein AGABI1DRAFT_94325 [Agaricus bisporus var. burnettii JB137-S8]|uniref:Uncharacterized protein n=1 Tax=Agaricus bisporus var. burnettii (strain JB137-S8 / ATCC MYA-4627 / FGSC 10392) TaxID=597362 RepID=K5XNK4_AGABU|nr:uncharacterized protein AGABI1DRAFT_94325 [Agaricus bisporus var. burnettii JB137-S8]EKM76230.1 hypothetical protein AGABI1DRAFT_94325 [Agaricus bisporus var. burnettii JB137-S8]